MSQTISPSVLLLGWMHRNSTESWRSKQYTVETHYSTLHTRADQPLYITVHYVTLWPTAEWRCSTYRSVDKFDVEVVEFRRNVDSRDGLKRVVAAILNDHLKVEFGLVAECVHLSIAAAKSTNNSLSMNCSRVVIQSYIKESNVHFKSLYRSTANIQHMSSRQWKFLDI